MAFLAEKLDFDFKTITADTAVNNEATTYATTLAVDMKDALRVVFCVNALVMAGSSVMVWTVEESATTTTGDFSGTALTTYTTTHTQASSHADTWKTIEVPVRAMTAGKRYLRVVGTETGSANVSVTGLAVRELVFANV
jgi:hypothetical protein